MKIKDCNLDIRLIKETLSFYYELNSDSHGYKHLDEVYETALLIKEKLNLDIPTKLIKIAVYIHDMFSSINRELHHDLGFKYVMDTNVWFLNDLKQNDRVAIAYAVKEHRASYKGEYTTLLSELLSAADRGKPDIKKTVYRSYLYTKETNPEMTEYAIYNLVQKHMLDKFSTKGYARYNDLYQTYFENDLKNMKEFFDSISITDIEKIVKEKNNG